MVKAQGLEDLGNIQICDHLVNQRGNHRCPGISDDEESEWDTIFVTVYNPSIESAFQIKITLPTPHLNIKYWSSEKKTFLTVELAEAHCFNNLDKKKDEKSKECDVII